MYATQSKSIFIASHSEMLNTKIISFRLVQKLRKKSKRDIETEKKERGFTLYLNAPADGSMSGSTKADRKHRPQRSKTTGAAGVHLSVSSLEYAFETRIWNFLYLY